MSWQDVKQDDLKALGFDTFRDYLISELYRDIRVKVLNRDAWTCWYCHAHAGHAKFLNFSLEVLRGDDLNMIVSICTNCCLK